MEEIKYRLKWIDKVIISLYVRRFKIISEKRYLEVLYRYRLGKKLDLSNPKTFNEKIQWLKLYDRKDIYTQMVDKYKVRDYIKEEIGEEYLIPLINVWDSFDEIDFDKLPNRFVLKCTHDSGGLVICRDKEKLDIDRARKKINKSLKKNFYNHGLEWPYKNIKPKIIAEKYMENDSDKNIGIIDYKFYCMNGEPKWLYVSQGLDNHNTAKISFFNLDFSLAPFGRTDYEPFTQLPKKPKNYNKMIELARKLSKNNAFLRVDLYEINNKIYFSELTFSPCSGFMPFTPEEYDLYLGNDLILPK